MKLLLAAIVFVCASIFLRVGFPPLVQGADPLTERTVAELERGDELDSDYIDVGGELLRLGWPEEHRFGSHVYLPLVDAETAALVRRSGRWTRPADGRRVVVVKTESKDLPSHVYRVEPAGSLAFATGPLEAIGTPSTFDPPAGLMALLFGDGDASESRVLVIEAGSEPLDRFRGAIGVGLGLAFAYLGLRLVRSWRRRRAMAKSTELVPVGAREPRRLRDWSWSMPEFSESFVRTLVKGGLGIVAVLAVCARNADNVAPVADDIARGASRTLPAVGRTFDDVARAAGDLAGEVAGQASNISSLSQILQQRGTRIGETVQGHLQVTRTSETYRRVGDLTYELTEMDSVVELMVRDSLGQPVAQTYADDAPPDRGRGEFVRLYLEPLGPPGRETIRVHYEAAFPWNDGGPKTERFHADAVVARGSWATRTTDGEVVLRFVPRGRERYGTAMAEILERSFGSQGRAAGLKYLLIDFETTEVPEFEFVLRDDELEIRAGEPSRFDYVIDGWG